jgi:hypothetical protein
MNDSANGTCVKVDVDLVTSSCAKVIDRIKIIRKELYETAITNAMTYRSWFTVKTRTREDAKIWVDNWHERDEDDIWTSEPVYVYHEEGNMNTATELINMCKLSTDGFLYLGVKHAQFIERAGRVI